MSLLSTHDLALVVCPTCRGPLHPSNDLADGGSLACNYCSAAFMVTGGFARLFHDHQVRGNDRLLRHIYDALPSLHDPAVRYLLALFQAGSERALRDGYLPRLELELLQRNSDTRPLRILEIGIGTGANLPLLRRELPRDLAVELWGVDLSEGMLSVCRRRITNDKSQSGFRDVRLLMADAHALPFRDGSFDRVFHIGAAGSYRDPARALAEMARVAVPGSPIVVVDEQLDPALRLSLLRRALFRAITFYEPRPHSPIEHLPSGAYDVLSEQVSPFFYSLRFRT